MHMKTYGYIRVSTKEQNESRQVIALEKFHIPPKNMYMDKQSGKDFNRPEYQKLLRRLRPGDLLIVKSIDRLGRNYRDILEQWRYITQNKHADIMILDMELLDTRRGKDLTKTLIADIVLQLLSYVAETERDNIRERQAEGIAAAKARGIRFGAPKKEKPASYPHYYALWTQGKMSAREAARKLEVSHNTFLSWAREKAEVIAN